MASNDRELAAQNEMERNRAIFAELNWLFRELDADNSGQITLEEFDERTKLPQVAAIFSALGLDVSDAKRFFTLLDVDGSCLLEIDEFVIGCMSLKGHAKTIGMETLLYENKRMMARWQRIQT